MKIQAELIPPPFQNFLDMNELRPSEIAVIVDERFPQFLGHIVLRTASTVTVEVMDLSSTGPGSYWGGDCLIKVRKLVPGESVVLTIK